MAEHIDKADYDARVFVNGLRRAQVPEGHPMHGKLIVASGEWSHRFQGHPWVKQSTTEGWAVELRGHCIRVVKQRMLIRQPYSNLTDLMPPADLVGYWRLNAERAQLAAIWRAENPDHPALRGDRRMPRA